MDSTTRVRQVPLALAILLTVPCVVVGAVLFNVAASDSPVQYVQQVAAHHSAFVAGGLLPTAAAFMGAGDLMLTAVLGMLAPAHTDLAGQVNELAQSSALACQRDMQIAACHPSSP
jgi:Flp pilus assembly protein protease CpaA